jgi:HEAT repeat protein
MCENEKLSELSELLSDPDAEARVKVLRALAQTSTSKVLDFLMRALEDPNPSVRTRAAEALGVVGAPAAGPAIGRLMADDLRSVRQAAAEALAKLGGPGFTVLAAGSHSENPLVRQSSAFGFAYCTGEQPVEFLIAALQDSDENVRYYAADSLSVLHPELALEPLIQALQRQAETEQVLSSVSDAIVSIGGEKARHLLLECVNHSDEATRRWVRVALEDLETPR